MWPDRVSNPGPLTYESGALPTALQLLRPGSCLQTTPTRRNEHLRMTFGVSCHIKFKEIVDKTLMKTTNNK